MAETMRVPIVIPEVPSDAETWRLGEWSVEVGDAVEDGDSLTELIGPGLAVELTAPTSGIVVELLRRPDHAVQPGEVVGWLDGGSPP